MKEYKVLETTKKNAEKLMNDMAKQGWEVVSVTYWTLLSMGYSPCEACFPGK